MTDLLLLVVGVGAFVAVLVALGLAEPFINSVMGWDDDHRESRRRNRR